MIAGLTQDDGVNGTLDEGLLCSNLRLGGPSHCVQAAFNNPILIVYHMLVGILGKLTIYHVDNGLVRFGVDLSFFINPVQVIGVLLYCISNSSPVPLLSDLKPR